MKKLNKKGFTLIELIVVIAILAILALILIPSLTGYIAKATNAKDAANCRSEYTKYQLDAAVGNDLEDVAAIGTRIGGTVTATVTDGTVGAFACVFGANTYSLANSFATP